MRLGKDLCSCIYIIVRNVQIQTLEPKPQIQPYAATLPNWKKKWWNIWNNTHIWHQMLRKQAITSQKTNPIIVFNNKNNKNNKPNNRQQPPF